MGFVMGFARLPLVLALVIGAPALSHEFWIEPEQYQVETGAPLTASLRNGQYFKGSSLAWFDSRFTRFETVFGGETRPVEGRMGDLPALQMTAPDTDGLMIVLHETTPATLTYKEWDKFVKFTEHKDFRDALTTHEARGWPKDGFRESYTRHVKALIAVGDGAGEDRAFGMETEIVALTNPYDAGFDGTMRVEVLDGGAPRADAQVEVFDRAPDETVEITLHRTDAEGRAAIPVTPGHDYLFDAVILREAPADDGVENAPVWETLWAALTFAVPTR